jgi:ATP-dependent protease HslVU (ClpYQ) peptidase subunit
MTCIVGLVDGSNVWMGGDSAGVDENYGLVVCKQPKVFRNGPYLIGYTSSFRMGQLLEHVFRPSIPQEGQSVVQFMSSNFVEELRICLKDGGYSVIENNRDSAGTFLVGFGGSLFRVEDDFSVIQSEKDFDACGCGRDLALGAMWNNTSLSNRQRIEGALSTASHFSAGVRRPFHVYMLEGVK